jgi:hypothetical protein
LGRTRRRVDALFLYQFLLPAVVLANRNTHPLFNLAAPVQAAAAVSGDWGVTTWFWLGFFIPLVGASGWAICCWRLCDTFQKSKWLTLAMVCPFLGWIPLVYLAEATRAEDDELSIKRLKAGYAF